MHSPEKTTEEGHIWHKYSTSEVRMVHKWRVNCRTGLMGYAYGMWAVQNIKI